MVSKCIILLQISDMLKNASEFAVGWLLNSMLLNCEQYAVIIKVFFQLLLRTKCTEQFTKFRKLAIFYKFIKLSISNIYII